MSFFKNPFKSKSPSTSLSQSPSNLYNFKKLLSSRLSAYPTKSNEITDLSQYNRGTRYGTYSSSADFQEKLNKASRRITYRGQKDKPEEDAELIKIMNDMNITSSKDFYDKIMKMINDTMEQWEKCKQRCSSFFCNTEKYPDTAVCNQKKDHISTKPINMASKDCQAQVALSVDYTKGQVWTNAEEETYLACANITPKITLITDLIYVYLLNSISKNPSSINEDESIISIFDLFRTIPTTFKDNELTRYVRKLNKKLEIESGGKLRHKSRKNKSKSRKNKSRKSKLRKNKSRKK